ncbi:MAG: cupin domain-containing protein [Microcoleus anatoxicus]|uniref:cupin domain-containing protein n=1 Tax=Microcoleus anatoxicus TaxID=2705319 RepID=UPI00366BB27A
MTASYTKVHFDFDSLSWLTSPRGKLGLEAVGLGLINLSPNEGYTFTHSHSEQEEVYIVIRGSGKIQINGEIIDLTHGDLVRVSPTVKRALKAEENGIFVICAGAVPMGYPKDPNARYLIDDGIPDYDDIPLWYKDNEKVTQRNAVLKNRMLKSQALKNNCDRQ